MSICPICASRKPGDPVCLLHPEACAFRDRVRKDIDVAAERLTLLELSLGTKG